VTGKAIARFVHTALATGRHVERWRYVARIANGDIETLDVFVKTETTFVKRASCPEDVGLTCLP
jgi:hypothetical protein